ncbi:zf-HC2 domain-containing protein [Oribacterium sp. P6A1]|uniref:zf-HC2 domain-containing protein n=1 Tax=Oribacterium sp. P6A1 TaxID=1410612 RepID=UPI00056227A1|nr:zf-HC2 domain-containing protein [Oribacterium sp. P6A1]
MTCLDARKRIYDYLNNKLSEDELKPFIDHVGNCKECMEELRITHMVYSGVAELDSDKDTDIDIDGALKKSITDAKFRLFRGFVRKIMIMVVDTIVFWAVLVMLIMQFRIWIF